MQDNGGVQKVQLKLGEIVSSASQTFSENWKPLVLSQLVLMGCIFIPILVCGILVGGTALLTHGAHNNLLAGVGITAGVGTAAGVVVLLTMIGPASFRMVVAAARGGKPQMSDLFSRPFQRAGTLVASSLLVGIAICCGSILFLIPGLMAATGFSMAHYFIIEDDEIGVVDSMKASWTLMYGYKRRYFNVMALFGLSSMFINLILQSIPFLFPVALSFQLLSTLFGWLMVATIYARLRPMPAPLSQQQPVLSASA